MEGKYSVENKGDYYLVCRNRSVIRIPLGEMEDLHEAILPYIKLYRGIVALFIIGIIVGIFIGFSFGYYFGL